MALLSTKLTIFCVVIALLISGCSFSTTADHIIAAENKADGPLRVETVAEDVGLVVALAFAPDG